MISLIIPTYNEASNIKALVEKLSNIFSKEKKEYELIIVDDNSPDKTWKIAESLSEKYNLKVIRRIEDRGLATAVVAGFDKAKGDIIGVMDADLSHPAESIPSLLSPIETKKAEITVGSRYVSGGKTEEWPKIRGAISKIGLALARPLVKIRDTMSGFFFMRAEVIKGVKLSPTGYKILLEVLVKGKYQRCIEVPYTFLNRSFGKSKIGLKVYLEYVWHIIKLYLYVLSKKKN
jgi:dolichol-phosphate mannosyltransferase